MTQVTVPGSREQEDIIYESATTRVSRDRARPGVVFKKALDADAKRRLQQEKDILARLAGIDGVVQLAPDQSQDVLAMKDCRGTSLTQMLASRKFDMGSILMLAVKMVRILSEAHRAGIIHRDINPSNIIVSRDGNPILIDFGLALAVEQEGPPRDDEGPMVGTLPYLAPEQTGRTARVVDHRADLYALGVTLYQMATGRPPFEAKDTLRLMHAHLAEQPVAPSQVNVRVPRGFSHIILRLLAKSPEERYQSAEGLLHDLQYLQREVAAGRDRLFDLGERDFPARLSAPSQLIGRDAELAALRLALADALHTPRHTVLIEGATGVGKSALVNGLRPIVAAAGGRFVYGKFDLYQKDVSTVGALTQALRSLGRLLLAQSGDELATQRRRILDRLGGNAGLVTRWLPEFAVLLGGQPERLELDPQQAGLHLEQAAVDLIGAIASPEHPLVIAMDDLQWASAPSLRILACLTNETSLRAVLFVGAYRPDEVGPSHALWPMLAHWQNSAQAPLRIPLPNLAQPDMCELTARMLRLAPERAGELAAAITGATDGNPFDSVELINALKRNGVLRLDPSGWQWDEAQVRRFASGGKVVDLLQSRIARLPQGSRDVLEAMGCLHSAVERRLLGAATGLPESVLNEHLRLPLEDGLLLPELVDGNEGVCFLHDRVLQAVLGPLDDTQRSARQLAIARRLAQVQDFEEEAAQQYLPCVAQIELPDEQRRAAELFLKLANRLVDASLYLPAERYLTGAARVLAKMNDEAECSLRAQVDVMRHVALYSLGRLEEADPLYPAIQLRISHALDLVEPTCLQMRSLEMRGKTSEAMQLGEGLLARLGVDVPGECDARELEVRLDTIGEWLAQDRNLNVAGRTTIRDPRLLGIARLLSRIARPASYVADVHRFLWLMLQIHALWAEHGPSCDLVAGLGRLSAVIIGLRHDYRGAFELAHHVVEVGELLGCESQTAEARTMFAGTAAHWCEPLETTLPQAMRAYERMQATGDPTYAGYVHRAVDLAFLDIAPTIDICLAEVQAGVALCERTGNVTAAAFHVCQRRVLRALQGQDSAAGSVGEIQFDDDAFLVHAGGFTQVALNDNVYRALGALLEGDLPALSRHAENARLQLGHAAVGYYLVVYVHLSLALARAWTLQAGASSDATTLHADLDSCREWFAARAADQPHNFLHLLRLIEAEQAWAQGDAWKASALFDQALLEAEARQRPWHRALILERAGLFHLAHAHARSGHSLLVDARDQYAAWGAAAKVARLHEAHPFLRERTPDTAGSGAASRQRVGSGSVSSASLDLVGILRASQALSSETSLDRLTTRVREVLAALTGATRVLLLLCNDDQWRLLAQRPGELSVPLAEAAARRLLPMSAFRYAQRTGEPLVIDDACSDDRFARDPYFAGVLVCSLLAAPIASQGGVHAMVLLENRQGRAAFNADRLDAVLLIAGQLAVSLANAQLYANLEDRVQERTRELHDTQAQLVEAARRAGKAEIANNVLHNVGNVLNSIYVSAGVMRSTIDNSRIEGLQRAVAMMNEHKGDLAALMADGGRGRALLAYLNEVGAALSMEQQQVLGDLERLVQSVDHVGHVVAMQQSHAGPSSVADIAQAQDLMDEALRLSAAVLEQRDVTVVRSYDATPPAALDKSRLLQILVNLIDNAARAMEGMPREQRTLTLGTGVVAGESPVLRLTVRDTGEGIASENLVRLFAHGFTTRAGGHGFGLHSCAVAAMEMGAKLVADSPGPGQGAVFALELPIGSASQQPSLGDATEAVPEKPGLGGL